MLTRPPLPHHLSRHLLRRLLSVPPLWALSVLALSSLGCAAGDLFARATPAPPPTRIVAPTFTPTPDFIQALIVVTPPSAGTPGVIIIPPGVDPRSVIPLPESPTPTVTPPTVTPTPSPIATPTVTPAVTPTPDPALNLPTPPAPGAGIATLPPPSSIVPPPTATSPQPLSPLLVPTPTPLPQPTPTPSITPTPFILVVAGLVNLRAGPGPDYPLVAQLGPNIPVAIVGQNPEGTWYEICCVNGGSVWVAQTHVQTVNDVTGVALVLASPPPTNTPTATPTETPTITPTPTATPFPFQIAQGPLYFPTNNELLTIWVKVMASGGGTDIPLPGYYLKVQFRNRNDGSSFEDRPNTRGDAPSSDTFAFSVPPGPAAGNRVEFNLKYEFLPPDPRATIPNTTDTRTTVIDGYWRIFLVDGAGVRRTDYLEFNTLAGNINREVYVAWALRQ